MTETIDLTNAHRIAVVSKDLPDDIKKLFGCPEEVPHPFKSAYAYSQYLRQIEIRDQNIRERGNNIFPRDSRFP